MITEKKKKVLLEIPEELHTELKIQSAKEKKTMSGIVVKLIIDYIRMNKDEYEVENVSYEELSDEEKKMIDIGREERLKGEFIDVEAFLKETEE
jgi:hypothetical protein